MEARNLASVGLSLLLAANCFMPCYTLAYADESINRGAINEQLRENQPERSGDEQADQGADYQGVLQHETAEEASSVPKLSPAVGAGRVHPSAHVLVEASYNLADSLIRLGSTRAYADESQEVEGVSEEEQEKIANDAGGLELSPGIVKSDADAADGGAAAEGHESDSGTTEGIGEDTTTDHGELGSDKNFFERVLTSLEDITYLLGEIADYYRQGQGGIQPLADDVYHQILGAIQTTNSKIDSLNAVALGSSAASNRHKWTMPGTGDVWNTSKGGLSWVISEATWYLDGIYSTNSQIRRSTSDSTTYLLNFQNWYKSAFGYGYGGTRVLNSESPGAWLEYIRENTNLTQKYLKATAGDGVEYSAASYLRNTRQDVGNIKSYLVANGGDGVPYPAASWLKSAVDELRSIDTYSGYIRTNTNLTQEKLSTVSSLTERAGNFLKAKADDGVEYSAASYLHTLAKNSNILLGYSKSKGSDGVEYSFTGFLNMIAERIRSSAISLSTLLDYEKANGTLVSTGFNDVLDKLGSLSFDASLDQSGIESRLDSITRLLTGAGVVENSKDILDAIFGDMGLDATEAASAAVGSAIQNAFPFCVPAVLKQILGLLQADPAPPEFHFDFWGAPLDFGFSDWQGLADMTSWLSRIGFSVVLFANSRRFVYSGGVAGD